MTPDSEKLKLIRNLLGLTQQEMADGLGVGQPSYSRVENGTARASREFMDKLKERYNINLAWFVADVGKIFATPKKIYEDPRDEKIDIMESQIALLKLRIADLEKIIRIQDRQASDKSRTD